MTYVYKQCTYRVSAKALVVTPAGLLMVREDSEYWDLPGGGVEHFEEPEDALRREVEEETGLHVLNIDTKGLVAWATYNTQHERPLLFLVYPTAVELGSLGANQHYKGVELAFFGKESLQTIAIEAHIEKFRKTLLEAVGTN